MENAAPLLIITSNPLFADTLSAHLGMKCHSEAALPSPLTDSFAAILFLPETLKELMQHEALAAQSTLPCLMLLPEDASRAQPSCRSLQRPFTLAQIRSEVDFLLQQPHKLHWPNIGTFEPTGLRLSNLFGQSLTLTEKEAALLCYLHHQPAPILRETLLEHIWHYHPEAETHTLETHLYRLRQKLQEVFDTKLQILSNEAGYFLSKN